jgi:hypothetical protein
MLSKPQGGKADFAFIKRQLSKKPSFVEQVQQSPFSAAKNPVQNLSSC